MKPKVSRRKEINKNQTEINETANKKSIEKKILMKTKAGKKKKTKAGSLKRSIKSINLQPG